MIMLTRIYPEKNMRRYYFISVQSDLLGGFTLIREWGRIGSAGRIRIEHFVDEMMAVSAACKIEEIKIQKGYRLSSYQV